jgi:hypothetical protein
MAKRSITTLLISLVLAGANQASADDRGFRGGSGFRGDGFHGRGFHRRGFHERPPLVTGGFVVDGYGSAGGDGYVGGYGYGNGLGDWYGISSGHDECPLFKKRVMTPEGPRVQMIPIC